jgi:ABC-2 type transport system permease protein
MARGFDLFGATLRRGDFDRVLLRPRWTILQLAGQELTLRRAGRLMQAVAVFVWGATAVPIRWSAAKLLLLAISVAANVSLFGALVVLQATLAFWTTEALEVMNCFTYGGVFASQYPLPAYEAWFRKLLTYAVPIACVSYFPALALMDKTDPLRSTAAFQWLAPLAGFLFFALSLVAWRFGVRHYTSTGS